jgi:hypothetical protein
MCELKSTCFLIQLFKLDGLGRICDKLRFYDTYFYELIVFTGDKNESGTNSKVNSNFN